MEEIREFVEGLIELEYELVSVEKNGKPTLTELKDVLDEIEQIGVKEIIDTYIEGIEFIDNKNATIGVYAVC